MKATKQIYTWLIFMIVFAAAVFPNIQKAQSQDKAKILQLVKDKWGDNNKTRVESVRENFDKYDFWKYVDLKTKEILGFISTNRETFDGQLYIAWMLVDPDHQRQGIGTKLLQFLDEKYPNEVQWLHVRESNPGAKKLYEKMGFEVSSTEPNHYGPGKAGYAMKKNGENVEVVANEPKSAANVEVVANEPKSAASSWPSLFLLFIFIVVIGIAGWFVYSELADDEENSSDIEEGLNTN